MPQLLADHPRGLRRTQLRGVPEDRPGDGRVMFLSIPLHQSCREGREGKGKGKGNGMPWVISMGQSRPIGVIEDLAVGVVEVLHSSNKFDYFFGLAMSLRTALQLIHKLLSLLDEKLPLFLLSHEHGRREFRVSGSQLLPLFCSHGLEVLKGEEFLRLAADGLQRGCSEAQSAEMEVVLDLP